VSFAMMIAVEVPLCQSSGGSGGGYHRGVLTGTGELPDPRRFVGMKLRYPGTCTIKWLHTHIVQSEVSEAPRKSADTQVESCECVLRQCWSMSLLP